MKTGGFLNRGTTRLKQTGFKKPECVSEFKTLKRSTFKVKPPTMQEISDQTFSIYVRLKYADAAGYVTCVTCQITRHYRDKMQAGHFRPRQHLATRYHEGNVFVQCEGCNCYRGGETENFEQFLIDTFGQAHVDEITALSNTTKKDINYTEIINTCKDKIIYLTAASIYLMEEVEEFST